MRTEYSAVIAFIAAGLLIQPAPAPAAVIGVVGPAVAIRAAAGKANSAELPANIGGALAEAISPQDSWGKWTGKSCMSELVKEDHLEKKYEVKYEDKTCKVVFTSPPSACFDILGKQAASEAEKYGSAKKDGNNLVVSLPSKAEDAKMYMHRLYALLPHKDVTIPTECGGKPKEPQCGSFVNKPHSTTTKPASTWATLTTSTSTTSTTTPASTWATIKSTTTTTTKPTTTTTSTSTKPTTTTTTTTTANSTWATLHSTTTTTTKPTTTTTTTTTTTKPTTTTTTTTTKKTTTTTTTTAPHTSASDWVNTGIKAMRFMPRDE